MNIIMAAYESNASPTAGSISSNVLRSPTSRSTRKNKPRSPEDLFPSKLYGMLEEVETLGLSTAVSWKPHGRAFIVKDKELFMTDVVPRFFKATKLRSFQRQCHLWGFRRIPTGHDAGSWWHESFVRGRPQDLKRIARTRVKGMTSGINQIPDFYEDNGKQYKEAPVVEISAVDVGSFIDKSGSFGDKSFDDISSVSANSSSDRDDDFEDLDEELADLFPETTPRRVSFYSPYEPVKQMPKIPDLNYSGNNGWNFSLKKRKPNWNHARARSASMCFPKSSPNRDEKVNTNQPPSYRRHSYSLGHDCSRNIGASAQEDVDSVDEFSKFIDKMIQLP